MFIIIIIINWYVDVVFLFSSSMSAGALSPATPSSEDGMASVPLDDRSTGKVATQPCTQRNIFGSHWLLSVQTLVATANMNFSENKYHTLQILLVSTEALFTSFSTIHMPHHHHHLCSA